MSCLEELEQISARSDQDIYNWFRVEFSRLREPDFNKGCGCGACNQKEFRAFSRVISKLDKTILIDILVTRLNELVGDKDATRNGFELLRLIFEWSFRGQPVAGHMWDYKPDRDYERVQLDFRSLSQSEQQSLQQLLPSEMDLPSQPFAEFVKMGVSTEIIQDYVNFSYETRFVPWFASIKAGNLSPKPVVNLDSSFNDRWKQFIEDQKFQFIYCYFDLEIERTFLAEKIMAASNALSILSEIPQGKRFVRWRRFRRTLEKRILVNKATNTE